jgi:thiol:disulfide interchange protein DsbD
MKNPTRQNSAVSSLLNVLIVLSFVFSFGLPFQAHAFGENKGQSAEILTDPLTARARLQPSKLEAGGTTDLLIDLELADTYHAYLDRFKLVIESPDDLKLAPFKVSPIVKFTDTVTKSEKEGVSGKSVMKALIEVPVGFNAGSHVAKFKLTYQACTDEHCLFPKTISVQAPFTVVSGTTGAAASVGPATTTTPLAPSTPSDFQSALSKGLFSAFLLVFVVGFLTALTPCIYPMIPITLAVLGARSKEQSQLKSFSIAVVYVLGIALTYAILGVVAASTGALFGSALSNIWVVTGLALIFVAMGLSMYGFFEIQAPAFIRNKLGAARTSSGYGGAFATGLIAGVVASPCVGPVLVSVLAYIAQTKSLYLGFFLLFTFAIGMGLPFLVLGMSSSLINKIPKAGPWMESVKFVFGTVMVGMAFYYIKPLYPVWLFHLLLGLAIIMVASVFGAFDPDSHANLRLRLRKGMMLAAFFIGVAFSTVGVLAFAGVNIQPSSLAVSEKIEHLAWKPYSLGAVEEAQKNGKPVLIDFTAEWCGACKELERYTFSDARVREASQKYELLRFDATEDTPAVKEVLSRYGVIGLPTLLFYDKNGKARTEQTVTGFEKADQFLQRMQAVAP